MKVIRVTKIEFELEDGRVIPHLEELDVAPSIEEFQRFLDESKNAVKKFIDDQRSR